MHVFIPKFLAGAPARKMSSLLIDLRFVVFQDVQWEGQLLLGSCLTSSCGNMQFCLMYFYFHCPDSFCHTQTEESASLIRFII